MSDSTRPTWTPERPWMGGTRAPAPDTYVSSILRAEGERLAREMTLRSYERWPELEAKFGERGRRHSFEDQFWHLSTLDTAWHTNSPRILLSYVAWLRDFLKSRGVGVYITKGNFELLRELLASCQLPPEQEQERQALIGLVDQSLALFQDGAPQAP